MSGIPGKKRRTALTSDDKKVWKAVTQNVVPRRANAVVDEAQAKTARTPSLKSTSASPSVEKAAKRHGAERRASRDELMDLVTDRNRQAKTKPGVQMTSQAGPVLTPGATRDIDRRTANRLKQGRLPIEGRLDLHQFLDICQTNLDKQTQYRGLDLIACVK